MTALVLPCWIALLVPGLALARRIDRAAVEAGLLQAIALSFCAAAAAVVAVLVPGHLVGLPMPAFTAFLVAFVAWGVFDLVRHRQVPLVSRLVLGALGLELLVIAGDMLLGARVGTMLGADAVVHVGRIRFLLEQGLVNQDHFVAGGHFYPIYHTNVLHALVAGIAQLTGSDPASAWFASLPMAKLLVPAGGAYAAWALFRSDMAAWVVALFLLGHRGPITFVLYPNQLAPWFLLPVLLGTVARALLEDADLRKAVAIASVVLVTGSVHPLYAVFAMLLLGPAVGIGLARRWWRRADDRVPALACAAALAVALPFPLVTWATTRAAQAPARAAQLEGPVPGENAAEADELDVAEADLLDADDDGTAIDDGAEDDIATAAGAAPTRRRRAGPLDDLSPRLVRVDEDAVRLRFGRGFTGGRGYRLEWLAAALAVAWACGAGRAAALLLTAFASVAAWLYVPWLCTLLLETLKAEWMVHRFATMQDVIFALAVPGAIAMAAERGMRQGARAGSAALERDGDGAGNTAPRWPHRLVRGAFAIACIHAGAHHAHLSAPYDWSSYFDRAAEPAASRYGRELRPLLRFGADLALHVPSDAVVLAPESFGMRAVMMHDCRIVAATSSSVGVPRLRSRRADLRRMLRDRTDEAERDALLAEHGVTHVVCHRPAPAWTLDRMSGYWLTEYGLTIIALRPPGSAAGAVEGDYATALLDADRIEEAIALMEAELALAPDRFDLWFRLGTAIAAMDDPDRAIDVFAKATALRPDDPRPWIMLGNAYSDAGDDVAAEQAYRTVLRLGAERGDRAVQGSAWFNIGNLHYRAERWAEAVAAYDETLRLQPGRSDVRTWRDEARARLDAGVPDAP